MTLQVSIANVAAAGLRKAHWTEDYYNFVPKGFHIIGFDGAGTVLEVGPECTIFKPGDDVSYVGSSTRQGSNAEYQLVNELQCARKPASLDFTEAASFGLTFGTAYQSLNDRLEIKQDEKVGILIVSESPCPPLAESTCPSAKPTHSHCLT